MKNRTKFFYLFVLLILPCLAHATLPVIDYTAVAQLGNQLSQLKQETDYIQAELKQLNGNQYQWSNAQSVINHLGAIVNQQNTIAYSAANTDSQFRQAYPGYQPPQNFSQEYKNNTNMTLKTLNSILQSMGTNAQDFQNENTRLAFLQQQSQSAKGQTQAIQAASQIASEIVSQTQLLRQTVIAQSNAQAVYYATQVQNEASAKAELEQVIQAGSTDVPAYGTSGHSLNPPGN